MAPTLLNMSMGMRRRVATHGTEYAHGSTSWGTADAQAAASATLGASRAMPHILKHERYGAFEVPKDSVYGVALAMPQLARSAGWPRQFTALAVRSQVHLLLNLVVQVAILFQINLETNVMNYYSGQMHLCSYGESFDKCSSNPDGPNCVGPGGERYTTSTLYANYQQWSTRMFARDALLKALPEYEDEIRERVKPGEYGIESPVCRVICVMLFVMAIIDELRETRDIASLLWYVPTSADNWLSYEPPSVEHQKKTWLWASELDWVRFRICGMPLLWKFLVFFTVVFPKFLIWVLLLCEGTQFLLETASIQDLIINSLALVLVVQMDELIMSRLSSDTTKTMMEKLEGIELFDCGEDDACSDREAIRRFRESSSKWSFNPMQRFWEVVPAQLLCVVLVTALSYIGYYTRFCQETEDGSYISTPLYPPKEIARSPINWWTIQWLLAPWTTEHTDEPTWSSPPRHGQ